MSSTEVSLQELQKMLIDGKISSTQFSRLCIQRVGIHAFMEAFNSTLLQEYKNFRINKGKENEDAIQDQPKIL